ncbi:MAG: hypothetical protein WBB01_15575 [Phormidesmis sp.]
MEQLSSCTAIGYRENSFIETQRSVRDRFQGVLLGLRFVPTAVCSARFCPTADSADKLTEATAFSLEQISAFLRRPYSFCLSCAPLDSRLSREDSSVLASIPGLLRYHDSWEQRSRWIRNGLQLSTVAARDPLLTAIPPRTLAPTIAQIFILGDLLELFIGGHRHSPIAALSQLRERVVRYALSVPEQQHYEVILTELLAGVSTVSVIELQMDKRVVQTSSSQNRLKTPEVNRHQRFIGAALIALAHPESYSIPVQMAAGGGGIASLVTAVIAGAGGGRTSLPALWQISPDCSEILSMADDLFDRWAGVAR